MSASLQFRCIEPYVGMRIEDGHLFEEAANPTLDLQVLYLQYVHLHMALA
jgi:hypothetical protein